MNVRRKAARLWWRFKVLRLRARHARAANRSEARRRYEHDVLFSVFYTLRPRRILSVGVAGYTQFYEELFPGTGFETIDIDPANARFGSQQRHTVGDIADLPASVGKAQYDVVLFNGVYGWGVNTSEQLSSALEAVAVLLRDNGVMVFGWNCIPSRDPLDLKSGLGSSFQAFVPEVVDGADTVHVEQSNGQRFKYLRRHSAAG